MGDHSQWVYDREASRQRACDRATLRAAQRTCAATGVVPPGGEHGRALVSDAERERQALCQHQWRMAGREPAAPVGCARPVRISCVECSCSFVKSCGTARSAACGYCAGIKRQDVAAIGRSGWSDRPTSRGIWLTLTAPGTSSLPFDRTRCQHSAGLECSGSAGCVVNPVDLAVWHARLPLNWSHFVTDVRRLLNPGMSGPVSSFPVTVEFFKTYEEQRRGALHVHAMIRVDGICTARRLMAALRLARARHGFGPQMKAEFIDLSNSLTAARVAGYCAKYTSKSADTLPDVPRLDLRTGELTEGGMRAWSSSRCWGATMAAVQAKRARWWETERSSPAVGSVHPTCEEPPPLDSYCEIYADDGSPGPINCPP